MALARHAGPNLGRPGRRLRVLALAAVLLTCLPGFWAGAMCGERLFVPLRFSGDSGSVTFSYGFADNPPAITLEVRGDADASGWVRLVAEPTERIPEFDGSVEVELGEGLNFLQHLVYLDGPQTFDLIFRDVTGQLTLDVEIDTGVRNEGLCQDTCGPTGLEVVSAEGIEVLPAE